MMETDPTPDESKGYLNGVDIDAILISEGKTIVEAVRHLGVSAQTYYRWRKEYGDMEVDQVRRLKELSECRIVRRRRPQAVL